MKLVRENELRFNEANRNFIAKSLWGGEFSSVPPPYLFPFLPQAEQTCAIIFGRSELVRLKKWITASVIILFALIIAVSGVCGW
jgi:hypothetical protein